MRGGGRRESGRFGGNGGYFGGSRGGRSAAVPSERPGCLVVCRSGLRRRLGVRGAWGGVSDWDRLNDFLRFVLDKKGGDTQRAHTTNPQSTHACKPAFPKALHNNHIKINGVFTLLHGSKSCPCHTSLRGAIKCGLSGQLSMPSQSVF